MSRTKSPSKDRNSTIKAWLIPAGACAIVGIIALRPSGSPKPSPAQGEQRTVGAYQPDKLDVERRSPTATGSSATLIGHTERKLTPELEERLRAAAHVSTVPAPGLTGAQPTGRPAEPLSPEAEAQRQQALVGWKLQVQQLLDQCVARPAAQRRPTILNVSFASAPAASGATMQQVSPVAVSLPPHELQRLWHDTDPDGLQECIDRVRMLPLAVPVAAHALPASMESLPVQL